MRFWTDSEDDLLRRLCGAMTPAEMARVLGRSESSTVGRIKRLGLSWRIRDDIDDEPIVCGPRLTTETTNLPPGIVSVTRHRLIG